MIKMKVTNVTKNKVLSENLGKPDTVLGNMLGLMFKDKSEVSWDGLYLLPCNSIHTFFCKFALDVYFLGKDRRVIRIIKGMNPWRLTKLYFSAISVIEVKAGLFEGVELGDQLEVTCIS